MPVVQLYRMKSVIQNALIITNVSYYLTFNDYTFAIQEYDIKSDRHFTSGLSMNYLLKLEETKRSFILKVHKRLELWLS